MRVCFFAAAVVSLLSMFGVALAQDQKTDLPAVAYGNGELEVFAGFADLEGASEDDVFRGLASITSPLGENFGLEVTLAADSGIDTTSIAGSAHLFTRDPQSYLLGLAGGYGLSGLADTYFAGPVAELYLDQFSLEATAGYLNLDLDQGPQSDQFYAMGQVAVYPTETLRLALGASSIAGLESVNARIEWQAMGVEQPLTFIAEAQYGEDDYVTASIGLKLYFSGTEKSLQRRHREDEPRNWSNDLMRGAMRKSAKIFAGLGPDYGVCPDPNMIDIDPGPGLECIDRPE